MLELMGLQRHDADGSRLRLRVFRFQEDLAVEAKYVNAQGRMRAISSRFEACVSAPPRKASVHSQRASRPRFWPRALSP